MENPLDAAALINPWLSLIALVLPLVVAYVTKGGASSTVKGWTLALLSGLTALVNELIEVFSTTYELSTRELLNNLLLVFATAVVAYKGGLVSEAAMKISNRTADSGIGTQVRPRLRDPETGRYISSAA